MVWTADKFLATWAQHQLTRTRMTATLPKDNTLVPLSLDINTNQEYQQRTRPKGTRVDAIVTVRWKLKEIIGS
jgi:hypothetical protein